MLDPADVSKDAPARFVRAQDAWAFVPHPLPPLVDLGRIIIRKPEDASRELGHLAGIGRTRRESAPVDPAIRYSRGGAVQQDRGLTSDALRRSSLGGDPRNEHVGRARGV